MKEPFAYLQNKHLVTLFFQLESLTKPPMEEWTPIYDILQNDPYFVRLVDMYWVDLNEEVYELIKIIKIDTDWDHSSCILMIRPQ